MASTDAISAVDYKIEISTDGTSFTDISGYANEVSISGGERENSEVYVLGDDSAAILIGHRSPVEITISVLYTEGDSDPMKTLWDAYCNKTTYYVRIAPKGGESGEFLFTSNEGFFTAVNAPPGADPSSADPLLVEATFRCGKLDRSTAT